MSKRRIDKQLEKMEEDVMKDLSPDERIKHTLEAVAEQEQEQAERQVNRLIDTCPTHNYKATDMEYIHKKQILPYIGTIVELEMKEALLHMQIAQDKRENHEGPDLHKKTVTGLQATLLGFEEFCQETLNIEPTTFLEATTNDGAQLFKMMKDIYIDKGLEIIGLEKVEELKEAVKEGLERKWEFIEQETN